MTKARQPTPATFHDQLLAGEHRRHAARLAEIKKMSGKLAMFEPTARALADKGIRLHTDHYLNAVGGVLALSCSYFEDGDIRLYNALVDFGFKEVKRHSFTSFATAILKQGRLQVQVSIPASHQYPTVAEAA